MRCHLIPLWDIYQAAVGLLAAKTDGVIGGPAHSTHLTFLFESQQPISANRTGWDLRTCHLRRRRHQLTFLDYRIYNCILYFCTKRNQTASTVHSHVTRGVGLHAASAGPNIVLEQSAGARGSWTDTYRIMYKWRTAYALTRWTIFLFISLVALQRQVLTPKLLSNDRLNK